MNFKEKFEDYTESEFMELLNSLFKKDHELKGNARERYVINLVMHIAKITEHPEKSNLLCRPPAGREDSPAGVLKEVKRWRIENGKPGFKPD